MNVFGDQITSKDLVSRVLSTAATRFDLDGDDENDYTDTSDGSENTERYGVGMFDWNVRAGPSPEWQVLVERFAGTPRHLRTVPAMTVWRCVQRVKACRHPQVRIGAALRQVMQPLSNASMRAAAFGEGGGGLCGDVCDQ